MTQGNELLEMIETVDHTDSDALDEIDVRVFCHVMGYKLGMMESSFLAEPDILVAQYADGSLVAGCRAIKYTRSQDPLIAIRPPLWNFAIRNEPFVYPSTKFDCKASSRTKHLYTPDLPTEYLAHLYAIIKAKIWDQNNKEKK